MHPTPASVPIAPKSRPIKPLKKHINKLPRKTRPVLPQDQMKTNINPPKENTPKGNKTLKEVLQNLHDEFDALNR